MQTEKDEQTAKALTRRRLRRARGVSRDVADMMDEARTLIAARLG